MKSEGPKNSKVNSEVSDWKVPCDSKGLCTRQEMLSSLNGPISFRQALKKEIDHDFLAFQKTHQEYIHYICAQLISVGGCDGYEVTALGQRDYELFLQGLSSCHHRLCHDYFQLNRDKLYEKAQKIKSKKSLKYFYLMAVKLPLPWYEKSGFLKKYLNLIDNDVLKYQEIGPLISAIPNHQGLKTFVAKRFFKLDGHFESIAVYLARYQNGWHDMYYKAFLAQENRDAILAFIKSMPVGCPRTSTVLAFKEFFENNELDFSKVLEETMSQDELDRYFPKAKLIVNKNSKCSSSSPPAF